MTWGIILLKECAVESMHDSWEFLFQHCEIVIRFKCGVGRQKIEIPCSLSGKASLNHDRRRVVNSGNCILLIEALIFWSSNVLGSCLYLMKLAFIGKMTFFHISGVRFWYFRQNEKRSFLLFSTRRVFGRFSCWKMKFGIEPTLNGPDRCGSR